MVLEDVAEPAYRLDRAVQQLVDACGLSEAAGLLLGDFRPPRPADTSAIQAFWHGFTETLSCPVAWGLPVGHLHTNCPIPLGVLASMQVEVEGEHASVRLDIDAPSPSEVS